MWLAEVDHDQSRQRKSLWEWESNEITMLMGHYNNFTSALYSLDEKKSKHASLVKQIGFWPSIYAQDGEAGKRHSKA